jgi:predicted nuclease of predicted toxin-antitoxin system
MKIKVDENMPQQVVPLLAAHGHDVATVADEGLAGTDDAILARAAIQDGRMLLTLDRGFGDIRRFPPGQHPGILVVRLKDQRPAQVEATLRALLSAHNLDDLAGCTVIVHHRLVRIRLPQPESQG